MRDLGRLGPEDPDGVAALCLESAERRLPTLVFCPTRRSAEHCARLVARLISTAAAPVSPRAHSARKDLLARLRTGAAGLNEALAVCVPNGVGIHHAGLTAEERASVEAAMRTGLMLVLVATSTLAAGVNLPAHRVLVRAPYVGSTFIDVARYQQMAGRAGRAGTPQHSAVRARCATASDGLGRQGGILREKLMWWPSLQSVRRFWH